MLKDGASAVYGSDAVAGVVNFIMLNGPGEKPYEGAELFALYGNTTETDAHVRQVYLRGGVTGLDGKFPSRRKVNIIPARTSFRGPLCCCRHG